MASNHKGMATPRRHFLAAQKVGFLFFLFMVLVLLPATSWSDTTVTGTISTDTTWALAGSPYIVTGNILVQGIDGAETITTLTIEAGAQVRFNGNYSLTVGGSSGNPGAQRLE